MRAKAWSSSRRRSVARWIAKSIAAWGWPFCRSRRRNSPVEKLRRSSERSTVRQAASSSAASPAVLLRDSSHSSPTASRPVATAPSWIVQKGRPSTRTRTAPGWDGSGSRAVIFFGT
ncbi:MAG: hypothetical protein U0133_00805 [Gemmatimonadales bacterium]